MNQGRTLNGKIIFKINSINGGQAFGLNRRSILRLCKRQYWRLQMLNCDMQTTDYIDLAIKKINRLSLLKSIL
jgi:hypothetical protein